MNQENNKSRARSWWWSLAATNKKLGIQALLSLLFLTVIAWGFFSATNFYFVLGRITAPVRIGTQALFIILLNVVFALILSKAFRSIYLSESQLYLEKEQGEAVLAAIGDAVFEVGHDRKVTLFNKAAERITGFSAARVVGKPYGDVLKFSAEDGSPLGYDAIEEVFRTGAEAALPKKAVILAAHGERIPVSDSAAPVRDAHGEIIGVVVVFRDVTKEQELENTKLEFLSLASHQLRTPLSGIKWLIETLQAEKIGSLTKNQKEYVNFIAQSNDRMIKLVHDLLSVIRLEGDAPAANAAPFTVKEILADVHEGSRLFAEKAGLSFTYEAPAEDIQVISDKVLLKTILEIFVSNAISYSKSGGRIFLAAKRDGEFVQFSVSDDGIGIPHEERKKIFTKFYRATNAKSLRPEGTGLGLYIAKFLSDILGGVIQLESEEGKGSIFRITVPLRHPGKYDILKETR